VSVICSAPHPLSGLERKIVWAEAQIWAAWGEICASGAPNDFSRSSETTNAPTHFSDEPSFLFPAQIINNEHIPSLGMWAQLLVSLIVKEQLWPNKYQQTSKPRKKRVIIQSKTLTPKNKNKIFPKFLSPYYTSSYKNPTSKND